MTRLRRLLRRLAGPRKPPAASIRRGSPRARDAARRALVLHITEATDRAKGALTKE
jgi:hypothetical protein